MSPVASFARSILPLGIGLCLWVLACPVAAQPAGPHLGYVYPAGGRQGTTFQVVLGGQFLDGATNAGFTGEGITAVVEEHTKPLTQKQINDLREKLQQLQDRRPANRSAARTNTWTAADERLIADIRRTLATAQRRPQNPAIAETVTLKVTVAPGTAAGRRELRLLSQQGLSNPLTFIVGDLPEIAEKESKPAADAPQRPFRKAAEPRTGGPEIETPVTLPAVVNGRILAGDVDRFRFRARAGQHLVFAASARDLIPYLADAVPGWFQATLALYDAKGKEVAYDDDFRFHPDPVLHAKIPADGEYVLEIKDAIYRGRDDFVYRIAMGELPFITGVFPLGQQAGQKTTVELSGWNLPVSTLEVARPGPEENPVPVTVEAAGRISNPVPFNVDDLPEQTEREPNDTGAGAEQVRLPLIVNGQIGKPEDADYYRFEGRAGQRIVAEVLARRLDSPLDSILRLTDAAGKQIAFNDDSEDKGAGLNTHHADSLLAATLPADGVYLVSIADSQRRGGLDYGYRLRLSEPRPDFALRIVPSSITVRGGGTVPLTVYALRKDGFTNAIRLALADAPAGFKLDGEQIPAGQDRVAITLTAPPRPTERPLALRLEGRAVAGGQALVRPVIPADDMMQAFFFHHLVPAQELQVAVLGRGMQRGSPRLIGEAPVKIPAGGTATVRFAGAGAGGGRFQFDLNDPPEGIVIAKVNPSADGAEIVLRSEAGKARPGLKGNLIVSVLPGGGGEVRKKAAAAAPRRLVVGTLPAIPFEVVEAAESR